MQNIFAGEFIEESSIFERNKSFCSDQKYKTPKTKRKQKEGSRLQLLTNFNGCIKTLVHEYSWIQIIYAFSYTYTTSTTRCNPYNSEVFELFVSIEEHFWRFLFSFKCDFKNIRWKPSSGFEFKIISIWINLWFVDLTPPAACYIAPEMSFVEPFVIRPESSKDIC